MFSKGSSNSISFATVTPSCVIVGEPNFRSSATLRPFGPSVVALALPTGKAEGLSGVFPLWKGEVPAEAREYREKMIEAVAAADDALMEKYLDGGSLSAEEIARGLKAGILEGKIIPVLCGDGAHGIGVRELLDFVTELLPAPQELPALMGKNPGGKEVVRKREPGAAFSAFAFKTMTESHAGALTYLRIFSGSLEAGNEVYNVTRERSEKFNQLYFPRGKERVETPRVVAGDLCVAVKLKDTPTNSTLSCIPSSPSLRWGTASCQIRAMSNPRPSSSTRRQTASASRNRQISTL
jgi:translation elongation factor EF-G